MIRCYLWKLVQIKVGFHFRWRNPRTSNKYEINQCVICNWLPLLCYVIVRHKTRPNFLTNQTLSLIVFWHKTGSSPQWYPLFYRITDQRKLSWCDLIVCGYYKLVHFANIWFLLGLSKGNAQVEIPGPFFFLVYNSSENYFVDAS